MTRRLFLSALSGLAGVGAGAGRFVRGLLRPVQPEPKWITYRFVGTDADRIAGAWKVRTHRGEIWSMLDGKARLLDAGCQDKACDGTRCWDRKGQA